MTACRTTHRSFGAVLISCVLACLAGCAHAPDGSRLRLYSMDCGQMFTNGVHAANPCFLIRHPSGDMLWDTGLPQSMVDAPEGVTTIGQVRITMTHKLTDMLAQVQLAPADIEYLAVSHSHFDHVGNAGLFAASTWIVDAEERKWAFRPAARVSPSFTAYRALETARTEVIEDNDDFDVFGDGSVTIIQAPGHTPGHTVLLLRLADAGTVLIAGDLWNTSERRASPSGSDQELETIHRIEKLITATKARVVRQHVLEDFDSLPRFPSFLH